MREAASPTDSGQGIRRSGTSRRERAKGNPALRKLILSWSIVLGVGALAAIGIAVSLWILPLLHRRVGGITGQIIDPETRVRIVSRFASPSEDETIRLVKRAIANRDPSKVDELLQKGSSNAMEVIDFFKDSEARDGIVDRYEWLSSMDVDGLLLEGVHVTFKGRDKPVERLALLTPDEKGVWKMDFDAFARSVKPSWDALLGKRADQATVRVFVARDAYFNGPFSDDTKWVCYGIASPDIDELLSGYCKVGSPEEAAMEKLFAEGEKLTRATLEIRRVKEADSRQFEITHMLAKDWVLPLQEPATDELQKSTASF